MAYKTIEQEFEAILDEIDLYSADLRANLTLAAKSYKWGEWRVNQIMKLIKRLKYLRTNLYSYRGKTV